MDATTETESTLTTDELAFLLKLANGGNWRLKDGQARPAIQSLIDRGYCRPFPERLGPLGVHTGEHCITITEAGRLALPKPQAATAVSLRTENEIATELRHRIVHFYGQTDGSFRFPNSCEGDLLRMTARMLGMLGLLPS